MDREKDSRVLTSKAHQAGQSWGKVVFNLQCDRDDTRLLQKPKALDATSAQGTGPNNTGCSVFPARPMGLCCTQTVLQQLDLLLMCIWDLFLSHYPCSTLTLLSHFPRIYLVNLRKTGIYFCSPPAPVFHSSMVNSPALVSMCTCLVRTLGCWRQKHQFTLEKMAGKSEAQFKWHENIKHKQAFSHCGRAQKCPCSSHVVRVYFPPTSK